MLLTGVATHKDIISPLRSPLSDLCQLNLTLLGLSLWDLKLMDSETDRESSFSPGSINVSPLFRDSSDGLKDVHA